MHAIQWIELEGRFLRSISANRLRSVLKRAERHCTWCGKPVTGRRLTWCGQGCVVAYQNRCQPATLRRAVWERDHGICQLCGRDVTLLNRYGQRDISSARAFYRQFGVCSNPSIGQKPNAAMRACGCPICRLLVLSAWEMDHKVPVVEGGGLCDISGLRLLCGICHRGETNALAARRAAARAAAGRVPGPKRKLKPRARRRAK